MGRPSLDGDEVFASGRTAKADGRWHRRINVMTVNLDRKTTDVNSVNIQP